jgi:hypothetical protein
LFFPSGVVPPLLVSSRFVVAASQGRQPGLSPVLRGSCALIESRLMLQGLDLLPMTKGFGSFFFVVIFFPERRWK